MLRCGWLRYVSWNSSSTYVLKHADTGVPHATTRDDYYGGRFIPKGAGVIPNLTALHQDEELYQNPSVFEPERFRNHHIDPTGSTTEPDNAQRDHFNYGFGRRFCPGVHVAEQSLFIVVSRVLWAFNIQQKPGYDLDMSSKSGMLQRPTECFTMTHDAI